MAPPSRSRRSWELLEKVYERVTLRELTLRRVNAKTPASFPVCYQGQYVGEYCADLVVDEKVLVES